MSVSWDGKDDLERFLSETPGAISTVGAGIVDTVAQGAAQRLRSAYNLHRRSGMLADRVRVITPLNGRLAIRPIRKLRAGAPHAHLFEDGTKLRRTKKGAIRGFTQAHPTFRPIRDAAYADLARQLVALVERAGFTVRGS